MLKSNVQLDIVFKALADPTRRYVLGRLSCGPASVSDLAKPVAMALPSFLQHLQTLERYGLVRSQKKARVRTYHINPEALKVAEGWLERQRSLWERRLDQLDGFLTTLKEKES